MIFFTVGIGLSFIGMLFLLVPFKGNIPFYGYHSPRAVQSEEHFRLAQKTSGKYFLLFGLLMALIGYWLKITGHTNFFIIEMLVLVFPIMPIFILTEKRLQKMDDELGRNKDEYFDDRR
ncbi:SdpI family protein [Enterococcus durans]|uniref:Integral membrane protein n=2 Tax=Enterococcus durans TaxID=53345 RepID=A0AB36S876_9ENTE|nr:SdpI family protein [Enterococcus durans]EOT36436.1 hypothetical protein OMS_00037 [Enterococcus durans ATCC 6056]EOU18776.1 hypothetical protein I571_01774 [Enterococcus durans ATCC 6056]PEH45132.1 hypothetical protein CRM96_08965 [Enterococcus durans]QPQ26383.1 SdpI family protein [Enterococcus durans]QXB38169.1 SdpI family protein [Enterococcus durans]